MKTFRVIGRFFWLGEVIVCGLADFLVRCAFRRRNSRIRRAAWLQRHSRRALRIFQLTPRVIGTIPSRGLLISNHVSYLDIPVLSCITPAVFVSKREVKFWPVFGQFAQLAGTIFVDRERRTQVGKINRDIEDALAEGALVVLFPEGTSSNGQVVLPFKSSLLEPAAQLAHPVWVSHLQYSLDDGDAGREVCYWGDHKFLTHVLNLLGKRTIRATVRFASFQPTGGDRKQLAVQLREAVLQLKDRSP
jgi:1-acyl-sn-glycerol-3-phosphate acyltransferase